MDTRREPRELAMDLAERSTARFQMAAVIFDKRGIFAWGWNHLGSGRRISVHAEEHAIGRANRKRLPGATIVIAGRRNSSGRIILAKPCTNCQKGILRAGIAKIVYSDPHHPDGWNMRNSAFV